MGMAENISIPVNVGLVLDLDSDLDGKIALSCIEMALSDFYATHGDYKTRLVLNTRDSMKDVVGAAAAALDLIKNVEVQAIIGPTTSMQANFVIELGEKAQVPIISFSASSPSLTSIRSPFFFRATQNDSTQVNAISALVQAFGWREAVPIYIDNEYGQGVIPYLTDALQAVDARVPYRSVISPSATDDQIVAELYKLMTMQTRVFIVHMFPSLGARVFAKAKEIGMMSGGYVWIMTDGLTDEFLSSPNASITNTMQGALGVRPYVPRTKDLETFRIRWKRKFQQENPDFVDAGLNILGLWAYDAATALALAVEKAGTGNLGFQKANVSSNSSTDLSTLGLSLNGPNLVQALSNITFKGLTGNYLFDNGQLQSSAFQIMNVNGNGGRTIGFWTQTEGIVKTLNSKNHMTANSGSNSDLSTVIWPGDTTSVPKGWEIPTNGKKLRIGVPMKDGFSEFVKVTRDPSSNTTTVTGYSIDVFDSVVKALPYALPYEFIPFAKPDGDPAGTYNDLIYQVYLKNFDAVVGDTTIVYNRSQYVDFTLPYTESGVSMIVPIVDNNSKNAWVFLRPLTWDLWVTSFCFFIFIGFVIWVLEHRINEDFRGPASHQAGTSFWFSFSTMVFAQNGFGFVFPKGSPLVPDVSRAVLNMTEGDKMKEIENAWFGKQSRCPDSSPWITSSSLSLKSFWGLFLIAGVASLLALIIFMVMFVYKERKMLSPLDSRIPIWRKARNFFRVFIQRDLKSHTFRKSEKNDRNGSSLPGMGGPSPSPYSVRADYFHGDGDPSSTVSVDSSPDRQPSQEVVINIDHLTNPNQERVAAFEVEHDRNGLSDDSINSLTLETYEYVDVVVAL
ncbi:hypothetical protein OIU76_027597 [Salix suchowensis]|nr:hypothetical protein OIU76_027597 [Salix suchowensis]